MRIRPAHPGRYFPTCPSRLTPDPPLDRWWVGVIGDTHTMYITAAQIGSGGPLGQPSRGPVREAGLPAALAALQTYTGLPLYDDPPCPTGAVDGVPVPHAAGLWFGPRDWCPPSVP